MAPIKKFSAGSVSSEIWENEAMVKALQAAGVALGPTIRLAG